jgi:hypothetical protein
VRICPCTALLAHLQLFHLGQRQHFLFLQSRPARFVLLQPEDMEDRALMLEAVQHLAQVTVLSLLLLLLLKKNDGQAAAPGSGLRV